MCLMLDTLGERYSMLPSEVLDKGSTFDLWVFDVAASYRQKQDADTPSAENMDMDVLQSQLQEWRSERER